METVSIINIFQVIGTIIAALIGAYALIKSNNSNISDRISRTQWAFEMYISFLGICLAGESEDDYKKYKAFFYLFYAYADEEIKQRIKCIDENVMSKRKEKAQVELIDLIDIYYKKYNLKRFGMKTSIVSKGMKRKIATLYKKDLNEKDL